jgi:hypothetical protein
MVDFKLSATLRGHEDDVRVAFTIKQTKFPHHAEPLLILFAGPKRRFPSCFIHRLCVARLYSTSLGTAVTKPTNMG